MTLVPWSSRREWDPFALMRGADEDIHRLFNRGLAPVAEDAGLWERAVAPPVDVIEEKDHFLVRADLPGIPKENIEVTATGDALCIKGERDSEKETTEDGYYRRERSCGVFHRSLAIPQNVDTTKVEANYKDGVLEVVLPKMEEAKPRQIDVSIA